MGETYPVTDPSAPPAARSEPDDGFAVDPRWAGLAEKFGSTGAGDAGEDRA